MSAALKDPFRLVTLPDAARRMGWGVDKTERWLTAHGLLKHYNGERKVVLSEMLAADDKSIKASKKTKKPSRPKVPKLNRSTL